MPQCVRLRLASLGITLLVLVSYFPAFRAGFVWDDRIFTVGRAVQEWADIWRIWFSPGHVAGEYHHWPLVYTTFWVEHKLWGFDPVGYHVVNVLLHLANTLILWRILVRLSIPGAWLIAAVFAVHPVHADSVTWVIERKDVLSGLFYLTAFLAWLRFEETREQRPYFLALTLFTAGLLSKSIVVTFPAALLVLAWWKHGRLTQADFTRTAPFFAVGLIVTAVDTSRINSPTFDYSVIERVLIAARALWFYGGKLLWPGDLMIIYPLWDISAGDAVAWTYLAAAAAVAGLLWSFRGRIGRGPLAGVLFFAITLSPTLGFIDHHYMLYSLIADRFQYLASIGATAVIVGAAAHGARKWDRISQRPYRLGVLGLAAVALITLGALTWQHTSVYRDTETFYRHIVSLNPYARSAHLGLSSALLEQGRYEEGLSVALAGIQRDSATYAVHVNAGFAYVQLGQSEEAEKHYRRSLEIRPGYDPALNSLVYLLNDAQRYDEAEALLRDHGDEALLNQP